MAFDRDKSGSSPRGEGRGEGAGRSGGGAPFFRRRKTCPFSGDQAQPIDWKDVKTLTRYISERGKIMPCRITAVSTKKQRELAQAIKRARFMAIMPYVRDEAPAPRAFGDRPERGERSDRGPRAPRFDRGGERSDSSRES